MSAWEPGDGWREVPWSDVTDGDTYLVLRRYGEVQEGRAWVRVDPVPPLPTEPYTVIRVTWQGSDNVPCVYVLYPSDKWGPYDADYLSRNITGFEVLSEPRAVTAKAVLAELEDYFDGAWRPGHERLFSYDHQRTLFDLLRTKFGVES